MFVNFPYFSPRWPDVQEDDMEDVDIQEEDEVDDVDIQEEDKVGGVDVQKENEVEDM